MPNHEIVAQLVEMGFGIAAARDAVASVRVGVGSDGIVEAALTMLVPNGSRSRRSISGGGGGGGGRSSTAGLLAAATAATSLQRPPSAAGAIIDLTGEEGDSSSSSSDDIAPAVELMGGGSSKVVLPASKRPRTVTIDADELLARSLQQQEREQQQQWRRTHTPQTCWEGGAAAAAAAAASHADAGGRSASNAAFSLSEGELLSCSRPDEPARTDAQLLSLLRGHYSAASAAAGGKPGRWHARATACTACEPCPHYTQAAVTTAAVAAAAARHGGRQTSDHWSCGFRNIQMLAAALLGGSHGASFAGCLFGGSGFVPRVEVCDDDDNDC
eukprot:SAG25_NODE_1042_length_4197_cov_5.368960_3_plen_329_part_00